MEEELEEVDFKENKKDELLKENIEENSDDKFEEQACVCDEEIKDEKNDVELKENDQLKDLNIVGQNFTNIIRKVKLFSMEFNKLVIIS